MRHISVNVVAVLLLLICRSAMFAQAEVLRLEKWEDPTYSPLARAARVQGEVVIRFRVSDSGGTTAVEAVEGHPLLVPRAEEAIKSWQFERLAAGFVTAEIHQTVFRFVISEQPEGMNSTEWRESRVDYDGVDSVDVLAKWSDVQVDDKCMVPSGPTQSPPGREGFGPGDFIEIARSTCYGSCPSYRVRLFRTGQVEWEGFSFVATVSIARTIVDPDETAEVLEEVATQRIWSLCNSYSRSITDSSSVLLSASIGGEIKTIDDYAESGPAVLHDLIRRVDAVADTHRWRHGEPSNEPLSNIYAERWYGKPGMTSLMQTATESQSEERLSQLLAGGSAVDDADLSGWTALMYAAAHDYGASVIPLLDAGADPNHKDLQGRTPLMAGATAGWFDEDLAERGANVNAQSKTGLTALMILASQAASEEIDSALKAGADPLLQDSEGRTAADYLLASNCRRNPLLNPLNEMWIIESDRCDGLDEEHFAESLKVLSNALDTANQTRPRRR